MLTVYLAKKCLPWYLREKQKKCLSLSEVSKTLGIYKIQNTSTHNSTTAQKTGNWGFGHIY